jgi:hypothetical protein
MSSEPQLLQPVPPFPPPVPPLPSADRFTASSVSPTTHHPLRIVALAAAFVVILVAGLAIGIVSQSGHITNANEATAAAQAATTAVQSKLTASENENANLHSQVSNQQTQLATCATATSLSVATDKALHKVATSGLTSIFGSSYPFDAAIAHYNQVSRQWVVAANACDPNGGYTFGS